MDLDYDPIEQLVRSHSANTLSSDAVPKQASPRPKKSLDGARRSTSHDLAEEDSKEVQRMVTLDPSSPKSAADDRALNKDPSPSLSSPTPTSPPAHRPLNSRSTSPRRKEISESHFDHSPNEPSFVDLSKVIPRLDLYKKKGTSQLNRSLVNNVSSISFFMLYALLIVTISCDIRHTKARLLTLDQQQHYHRCH